jgi:cytochrome c oxidase cbb3-type subunit 3
MSEDKNKHPEEQDPPGGRSGNDGSFLGRDQGVQQPASALVAVDLLRHDRLGHRLHGLYPAWPLVNGATPGILGFSTRANVAEDIQRFDAMNADVRTRIAEVELAAINPRQPGSLQLRDPGRGGDLATWCSQCHGSGAAVQASGYPNLLDDDWLWGGTIEDIHITISHGIRNEDDMNARYSEMTAFEGILTDEEIGAVVQYVRNISGQEHDGAWSSWAVRCSTTTARLPHG